MVFLFLVTRVWLEFRRKGISYLQQNEKMRHIKLKIELGSKQKSIG